MHSTRYKMNLLQSSRAIYVFWILCIQIFVLFFVLLLSPEKYDFNKKLYYNAHHIYKTFAMSPRNNNTKTELFYIRDTEKLIKSFYDWTWNDAKESFCASATLLKYHLKYNNILWHVFFYLQTLLLLRLCIHTKR